MTLPYENLLEERLSRKMALFDLCFRKGGMVAPNGCRMSGEEAKTAVVRREATGALTVGREAWAESWGSPKLLRPPLS